MKSTRRTRVINTSQIIRQLWIHNRLSRVELARQLGLNKSTVTQIVNRLLENGLIIEGKEGSASPQGGRKPVELMLDKDFGLVAGIELRPDSFLVNVVDLHGTIRLFYSKEHILDSNSLKNSLNKIIIQVLEEIEALGLPCLAIGVGISGIVNPLLGVILWSIPLNISEPFNFKQEIDIKHKVPVFVENDANCCSWGELTFHRSCGYHNFLFVLIEFRALDTSIKNYEKTAVGLGVVIGGKVHYGKNYSAGEFQSIFKRGSSRNQFDLDSEESFHVTDNPKIFKRFILELARNIALLVNAFNLSQVFIGGDIHEHKDEVRDVIINEIQENWPYPTIVDCEVLFSSMGEKAVAYGAAGMVLNNIFRNPASFMPIETS